MSGFCSSRRHSATRRSRRPTACRSPHPTGGRRSVGGDFQLVFRGCARRRRRGSPPAALFLGQRVEIGAFLGVGRVHRVQRGLAPATLRPRLPRRPRARSARGSGAAPAQVADLDPGLRAASPSKSVSTPAMIFSTVDLLAPFRPSRPILAPGKKLQRDVLMICRLGGTTWTRGSWCRCTARTWSRSGRIRRRPARRRAARGFWMPEL